MMSCVGEYIKIKGEKALARAHVNLDELKEAGFGSNFLQLIIRPACAG